MPKAGPARDRLQALREALPRLNGRPEPGLTADTAATEFAAWLRDQAPDQPHDLEELVKELAGSWNLHDIGTVYATLERLDVARALNDAKMRSETELLREALIGSVAFRAMRGIVEPGRAFTLKELCEAGLITPSSLASTP